MMYMLIKAFHVASVATWIGGMLVMALVLNVVQKTTLERSASELRMLSLARRWDQRVTSPALGLSWLLGAALVCLGGWHLAGWLMVKLVFVLLLSALHGVQAGYLRRLADAPEQQAPALLKRSGAIAIGAVVVIAIMVILKPF